MDKKRVTVKLKCPNPLFEKWLTIWKNQATEKNVKTQYIFSNALKSLRKYPLPLESGKDCAILKGFGDKLCKMLDDKLKAHRKVCGSSNTECQCDFSVSSNKKEIKRSEEKTVNQKLPTARSSATTEVVSPKSYIPHYGSGAYAILVTLYEHSIRADYKGFLLKAEIIEHGKHLVNCSFTKPDPGSRYTAWSSVRTLITKNLVSKVSNPAKFSLTLDGLILAKKLYDASKGTSRDNMMDISDIEMHSDVTSRPRSPSPLTEVFHLNPIHVLGGLNEQPYEHDRCNESSSNNKELSPVTGFNQPNNVNTILKSCNLNAQSNVTQTTGSVPLSHHQEKSKSLKKSLSANTVSTGSSSRSNFLKKHSSSTSVTSSKTTLSSFEDFAMAPFSFDIILYVDNNETSGSSNSLQDEVLVELNRAGINFEVKDLKVGDFTWICRHRISKNELVLPYIIERKRMDDFAKSIKDKRYYEQKFRLKRSGIENLTYLVESHGSNKHVGLPVQTLLQAATNTAIQENFFVKFTDSTKNTAKYLINFSRVLVDMFKSKALISCPKENIGPVDINNEHISLVSFREFNESSVKNKRLTVTDLFVKMLIQIKGMSVDRALAITQKYPTPKLLKSAFEETPRESREKLLSSVKYGSSGKLIGVVLSKTVCQCFCYVKY